MTGGERQQFPLSKGSRQPFVSRSQGRPKGSFPGPDAKAWTPSRITGVTVSGEALATRAETPQA